VKTTEAQKQELTRLGYFLAKFLDRATTDAEATGAVNALVTRLRKMHQAGERDYLLAVVTREEAQLVLDWRNGETGPATQPTGAAPSAEPVDPFFDDIESIFSHGVKEAAKAGATAVTSKIPDLIDELFKNKRKAAGT
jgi:hypothetical protein